MTYIREIVPFFNVVAYYQIGYRVAGRLLNLFYKVTVDHEEPAARGAAAARRGARLPDEPPSNADYVLVSYALAGQVAISYAVGEWARAFPLEHMFKAFGSYFVRRKYREPLYHAVLERYVQLITREGVTQGIFLEGGLTRDGTAQVAQDRAARLRPRHRARPGVRDADSHRSRRRQLRSRARGSLAPARAGVARGTGAAVAPRRSSARWRAISGGTRRAGHAPVEALRPRRGGRRRADAARRAGSRETPIFSTSPSPSVWRGSRRSATT